MLNELWKYFVYIQEPSFIFVTACTVNKWQKLCSNFFCFVLSTAMSLCV